MIRVLAVLFGCIFGFATILAAWLGYLRFEHVQKGPSGYRLSGLALGPDQECHGGMVVRRYVNRLGYKITYYVETENGNSILCVLSQPNSMTKPVRSGRSRSEATGDD